MNDKLHLVICDNRGLTLLGQCIFDNDSDFIEIKDARCVCTWGVSGHLAELIHGPTSRTKLGAKGTFFVSRSSIVGYYETDSKLWS